MPVPLADRLRRVFPEGGEGILSILEHQTVLLAERDGGSNMARLENRSTIEDIT